MRRMTGFGTYAVMVAALGASGGVVGADQPAGAAPPSAVIELDGAGLEQLRHANPNHFARAQRILTAANYLCRPRGGDVFLTALGAQDLSCQQMLLETSNPPKWRIAFRLDQTRYAASIVVTDDPPRLLPTLGWPSVKRPRGD
jgi:hypothetical protein